MPVNLSKYAREVEGGLRWEKLLMDEALERQAFYDYQGIRYHQKHFRRGAETEFDFQGRSHRSSGFLREAVDKLCSHMYCPGPARRWSEDAGNEFLQKVWKDNLINSLMLEAEKLATLNHVAAIQIDAGTEVDENGVSYSNYAEKPICYRVWGREDFAVWTDPNSASTPIVCCTKDKYDHQTRYRLWSDTEVWTFLTKKEDPGVGAGESTSGGTMPLFRTKEKHDYGCLPFTFIHYTLPIRDFNVIGIGDFLFKSEVHIDDRLMRLDETLQKYLNPIPVAKGVPDQWKLLVQPGRFIRMPTMDDNMTAEGIAPPQYGELSYLEAHIDIQGAWDDLKNYIEQCLEAADIPKSAVRMEAAQVSSGIALIVEQEPLIKRAENRRPIFMVYEEDLAKRTLICAGNHYGKGGFVKETEQGHLTTGWPQPRLAVLTEDLLNLELMKIQNGLSSPLMAVQNLYGGGRDEAVEFLKQVKADNDEVQSMFPEMVSATGPPDPEAEQKAAEMAHQQNLEAIAAKQGSK